MRTVFLSIVSAALLFGCGENSQLSKEDEKLAEAVLFAFTGIEDNLKDHGITPWQRVMVGNSLEYRMLGNNRIGTSSEEFQRKIRASKYVRYVFSATLVEKCVFRVEDKTEFSVGDSTTNFSAAQMVNSLNSATLNFGNAHTFSFLENNWGSRIIVIEGPRVYCSDMGYCENKWTSENSGMAHNRFGLNQDTIMRRARAVDAIKAACPGRTF